VHADKLVSWIFIFDLLRRIPWVFCFFVEEDILEVFDVVLASNSPFLVSFISLLVGSNCFFLCDISFLCGMWVMLFLFDKPRRLADVV